MNKLEIQKRVLQNGKPLSLDKFEWDEKAKVFSSVEDNLVLDFAYIDSSIITVGDYSTITAGYRSIITAGYRSIITAGCCSTITAGYYSIITAGYRSIITVGDYSTITVGDYSTITAGCCSTITAGYYSIITVGDYSTITAEDYSTITAGGSDIVIVNRNVFEVILPKKGDIIQICPHNIAGHLVNGKLNGLPHIIADGILSKIISKKGNIYKVVNRGQTEQSYLIESEEDGKKVYSHGKTLKEARDSLVYKIGSRDTTAYEGMTVDTVLTKEECIKMYRAITGACSEGTKYFVESQKKVKSKYKISEIIEATKGQFGNELLVKFFNK